MGFSKQTVRDVPLDHQTVLVRADYNVPLDKNGRIRDDLRVKESIPTLKYLLDRGCKVVVISHLGRPEGKDASLSLRVVAERLADLLGHSVGFVDDVIGDKVQQAVKHAPSKSVVLLENLRFYKEEEANDEAFARKIADAVGARYFVQDGFGVVHRAHASTHAITLRIPSVAGLLLEKELTVLSQAIEAPKRPLVAILGGAKVSDKIKVIERFVEVADTILIGGAMANTFLAYKGNNMQASMYEQDQEDTIKAIYNAAAKKKSPSELIILPHDVAVAKETIDPGPRRNVDVSELQVGDRALDIGDASIETYAHILEGAGTVLWNGPLGFAEMPKFSHGSARVALTLATHPKITSVIGGGDTADFVLHWASGDGSRFTHISTGGGASLDLIAGLKLPGVESLLDKRK